MSKKNPVYDELFKKYTTARKATKEKEMNALSKIDEAESSIEENKKMMDEALMNEDQETYTRLYEANAKNTAKISFFKGILCKLKDSNKDSEIEAHELYMNADTEISRLKSEFEEEFVKRMMPVLEYAENIKLQVELLELAKNRISNNLENKKSSMLIANSALTSFPLMGMLDSMVNNATFQKVSRKMSSPDAKILFYNWHFSADEKYSAEKAKWD